MAKQEKRKLSLTSDKDVETHTEKKLDKDVRRCKKRRLKETGSKNRCAGGTTLNCSCRTCEVEVSCGGEADLHRHLNSCKKNPGHQNFVPVDQFSMEHLPSDYRNNDLLDLIRVASGLTVRLSVNHISDRRPKTWPGSEIPYPFSDRSKSNKMLVGTGWVYEVDQSTSQSRCSRCNDDSSADTHHGKIRIRTAAHNVYDEHEAQHTTCHLFFDRGGTPNRCPGVVALKGMSSTETNTEEDWCRMEHVTCDPNLIDRLDKMLKLYRSLENKLTTWFRGKILDRACARSYSAFYRENMPCFIVSHPHGCSKQVSVGYITSRTPTDEKTWNTRLTYTTPTCRGSSGAHVFLLGNFYHRQDHVHGGSCKENKKLNYSPEGLDLYRHHSSEYALFKTSEFKWITCRFCLGEAVEAPTLLLLNVDKERQVAMPTSLSTLHSSHANRAMGSRGQLWRRDRTSSTLRHL